MGHSTTFEFPLTLSVALSQIKQNTSSLLLPSMSIVNADLGVNYILNDVWNLSAGVTVAMESQLSKSNRTGFHFNVTVPVWNIATFELRAEKSAFKNTSAGQSQFLSEYDESIVRASLSKYW
jgi:hypothetical protein